MSKAQTYPYPSPNKGRDAPAPTKGVPRTEEDKAKIAHSIRLQNRNAYGFYKERAEEEDMLYLIRVIVEDLKIFENSRIKCRSFKYLRYLKSSRFSMFFLRKNIGLKIK